MFGNGVATLTPGTLNLTEVSFFKPNQPLSDFGFTAMAAASTQAIGYTQPDYTGGVVIVFGAEGRGLRRRVADSCDALVALPLRGRIGSLNVNAAAGALLYTVLQKRGPLDRTP